MNDDTHILNKTNSKNKHIVYLKKGFYKVLTQFALLVCIFVSVAVSQANKGTGNSRPNIEPGLYDGSDIVKIHQTINGKAARYKIHGIDVSRYQKQITWPKIKMAGVDFAFIKATEGVALKDSFFDVNWEQAKMAGIRRGAYHFYIAEKDPAIQAANFIFNTTLSAGDLPPVLDVEVTRGMSGKVIRNGMKIWLDMVENAYGKKPIIYTGYNFYRKYLEGHFTEYPLWIAHYNGYENASLNREWLFWQHTDKGVLAGIPKEVDFNVFRGEMKQLDDLCIPASKEKPAYNFVSR